MKEMEKTRKKRKYGSKLRAVLVFMQHLMLAAVAVSIIIIITGSTVVITGKSGKLTYTLDAADQEKSFEDSNLFNTIYGQSVADIIRFCVIRSQLETDGEFDGRKVIDVTAYNYRNTGIPERYVTARYYLEDLLKWHKYGAEFTTSYMTMKDLNEFLADKTMMTIVDSDSKYYNTSDASYMKSDIGSYTFVDDVSSNMLPSDGYYDEDDDEGDTIETTILINRYKTVDEKNIEDYTADLSSYIRLRNNVVSAMDSLGYNYDDYSFFNDYYDNENSNLLYCVEKTVGKNTEYFTNMQIAKEELESQLKNENMAEFFCRKFDGRFSGNNDRYLYYSPSEMIYDTNSGIEERTVRSILKEYDYAYPENVRIWIGVDTSYPINDTFAQGHTGYQNYFPYFWQLGIFAILAMALYLILFMNLTVTAGREIDEKGDIYIRLTGFDKIPTEIAAVLLAGVTGLVIFIIEAVGEFYSIMNSEIYTNYVYNVGFKAGIGIGVFILDAVLCLFYYSLVRRIKTRTLWKNSYLRRLCKKGYKVALEIFGNSSMVVRTIVPYAIFVLFNLLMISTESILDDGVFLIVIFIVAVIDIFIGLIIYRDSKERQGIVSGIGKISEGDFSHQIDSGSLHGDNIVLAESVNSIGKGIQNAVEVSMKDERMKTELITNVSHDIKTPLTSIINYVDLIKREDVENERVRGYIKVLDEKSQRLKQLIDDLVEASKISSGNISLHFEKINLTELLNQTIGEFSEKFEQKGLSIVMNGNASNVIIEADSRSIWRVMENLFNNVYKYALERTRVYVTINCIEKDGVNIKDKVEIAIKNISAKELNCNPDELTERFIRGDESRTTEGSGLGLSIAKNLTEAQNGTFEIQLDGDLFKVVLTFPVM